MTEEQLSQLLDEVLWGYGQYKFEQAKREARSFVHYTTTEAALSIINNQEIWLRNSGVMNDYSEMAHGEACLRYCLFENADDVARAKRALDAIQEGMYDRTVQYFVDSSQMRRAFTYLLSISEHGCRCRSRRGGRRITIWPPLHVAGLREPGRRGAHL